MKPFRLLLPALFLLLAACAGLPGRSSDVEAVLAASGVDAQLAWLSQPLQSEKLKGPLALVPDDWISTINAAVAGELQPAEIRGALREALQRELSARELGEVQRFYETPVGLAVVAVESGAGGDRAAASADPATVEALASATGLGQAVSRLAEKGLGDAFDIALKTDCLGQGKTPFAGLVGGVLKKAQLRALRAMVNDQVSRRYAALTPAQQADYLAFTQSGAGRKFFRVRGEIVGNAADRAGTALGAALTPRFNALCKP